MIEAFHRKKRGMRALDNRGLVNRLCVQTLYNSDFEPDENKHYNPFSQLIGGRFLFVDISNGVLALLGNRYKAEENRWTK